jgi:hypothetical protein
MMTGVVWTLYVQLPSSMAVLRADAHFIAQFESILFDVSCLSSLLEMARRRRSGRLWI